MPESAWIIGRDKYANDKTLTYSAIGKQLGVSTNTVVTHATRGNWQQHRALREARLQEIIGQRTLRDKERRGTIVEQETAVVTEYLDSLDKVLREFLLRLGAIEPRDEREEALYRNAASVWAEMKGRDLVEGFKRALDSFCSLSDQKRLIVGKPNVRLEVSGAPRELSEVEESLLERLLSGPMPTKEPVDLVEGSDGWLKPKDETKNPENETAVPA